MSLVPASGAPADAAAAMPAGAAMPGAVHPMMLPADAAPQYMQSGEAGFNSGSCKPSLQSFQCC
jgi:hypothetical protein